jgi:excisionase family DNA binding protein
MTMTTPADEEYVTVAQAASLLIVSQSTVWRWIQRGDLPAFRKGRRRVLVKRSDLSRTVRPLSQRTDQRPEPAESPRPEESRERALAALVRFERWQQVERDRRGSAVGPAVWELIREMRDDRTRRLMGE